MSYLGTGGPRTKGTDPLNLSAVICRMGMLALRVGTFASLPNVSALKSRCPRLRVVEDPGQQGRASWGNGTTLWNQRLWVREHQRGLGSSCRGIFHFCARGLGCFLGFCSQGQGSAAVGWLCHPKWTSGASSASPRPSLREGRREVEPGSCTQGSVLVLAHWGHSSPS